MCRWVKTKSFFGFVIVRSTFLLQKVFDATSILGMTLTYVKNFLILKKKCRMSKIKETILEYEPDNLIFLPVVNVAVGKVTFFS